MDEFAVIRVLIVEDHPVVREGLQRMLARQSDIQVLAETEYGDEAVRLVAELAPDVVVLDLVLDNSLYDGLETLRQIREISPSTHVLVLSAYADDEYIFPALTLGAVGYMLKRGASDEVVDAVRAAAKGYYHLHPLIIQKLLARLQADPDDKPALPEPVPEQDRLTEREQEILPLLTQGLTNLEIAQKLKIARPTVKTHVSNILRKLDVSSRREALLGVVHQARKPPQPA